MDKKCNKCLKIKNTSEFHKESRALNGFKPRCKKCSNEYYSLVYYKYKKNKAEKSKIYRENNKEKIAELKKHHKKQDPLKRKATLTAWRIKNRGIINKKANEFEKNKVKTDSIYRAKKNMRKLIYRLKIEKRGNTSNLLGYTINDLIKHLGRLPEKHESLDHKIPITWFVDMNEIKLINHLENLQILTRSENSKKLNTFCHSVSEEYYNLIKHNIKPQYLNKLKNGK